MPKRLRQPATAATAVLVSALLACALVPSIPAAADEPLPVASAAAEAEVVVPDGEEVVPAPAEIRYDRAIADANRFQLVLVVRFAGDEAGEGATGLNAVPSYSDYTQWESLLDRLNGFSDSLHLAPTLYSYLKEVSEGACRLQSLTPQDDGGRVRYLTLPRTRDAYAYPVQVVEDALAAFNGAYPDFNGRSLDGDGDGYADNVLVIPEVGNEAPQVGSPLWPHKGDFTGSGSAGSGNRAISVGSYTMVDTSHLLSTGTIVHETLHAFGAKDLYRAGVQLDQMGNRPVGVWDIMAEHGGSRLMRPLAITRQDCGWIKLSESKGGSVTLHAPGSGKPQAVKFKTDASASEYFVAEFRWAASVDDGYAALDAAAEGLPSTIGGSGLIVYRVNPAMKLAGNGNKGERDYVYLFRPGETGAPRGDGAGDLRHAQLSVAGRSVLGSADLEVGLAEGAITYSNGKNSGAVVRVTAQGDDSITFDLELPDADALGLWKSAVDAQGTTPLTGAGFAGTSLVKGADGAVFQLCERLSGAEVYRFDGSAWTDLGTVGAGFGSFAAVVYRNELYVAGVRRAGSAATIGLWRWTGRAWSAVATAPAAANRPVLGVAGGRLYLFADGSGGTAQLYVLNGAKFVAVGSPIKGLYVAGAELFDIGGSPALMNGDFTGDRTVQYRLAGTAWKSFNVHSGFAQTIVGCQEGNRSLALTVAQDGTVHLVDLSAGGAAGAGDPLPVPAAFSASVTLDGDELYGAVVEQGTQTVRAYRAPASSPRAWEPLGTEVIAPSTGVDIATLGDAVLVASYGSSEDPVALRQFGSVGTGAIGPMPPLAPEPLLPTPTPESDGPASSKPTPPSSAGGSSAGKAPAASGSSSAKGTSGASSSAKGASTASSSAAVPSKPKATAFTKVKGARRAVILKWKKQAKTATGYQIRLSTSKKFTKKTTKTLWVKSAKKASLTVKKLKAKRAYYVQIRTYKTVDGKKLYSSWSKMKKVKTK